MPMPIIEALQNIEQSKNIEYFIVDLTDEETPFDSELFDKQLREICVVSSGIAKFILAGDRFLVFSGGLIHAEMNKHAPRIGLTGALQCAGTIYYDFSEQGRERRKISDFSNSLEEYGLLRRYDSDQYKRTVLKEKLGRFFTIE